MARSERWQQIEQLLDRALDLAPGADVWIMRTASGAAARRPESGD